MHIMSLTPDLILNFRLIFYSGLQIPIKGIGISHVHIIGIKIQAPIIWLLH